MPESAAKCRVGAAGNPVISRIKTEGALRMRVLRAGAMIALLMAGPAYAQKGAPAPPAQLPKSPSEIEAEKSTERAYKNSLRNIPDQPPADPWGGARAVEAPKAAAKDPPAKRTKASGTPN
jgi:hypothetical protein